VEPDEQHCIWDGPGHLFETELPAQSLFQRQLPALVLAHDALVQHLMSAASAGQRPETVTPPAELQLLEEMQTPDQI
jgi:hypothetical protein